MTAGLGDVHRAEREGARLPGDCSSAQSNMKNKSRLELLQTREQLLDEVFEGARGKITGIQNDKGKYKELVKGLMLQVGSTSLSPKEANEL